MAKLNQLKLFFWNIDPGYFNLKQAIKTIAGILITVGILYPDEMVARLMAGMVCGISMQGVVAKTRRGRVLQVFLFDLGYFAAFSLGLFVRDHPIHTAIALASLGFIVNYIRRFDLEKSFAPMMTWLLCFTATILPFQNVEQAWGHLDAILIGLIVSATMILLVFPENYPTLFLQNSNRLFKVLGEGMAELRHVFLMASCKQDVISARPLVKIQENLAQLIDTSQTIEQNPVFGKKSAQVHEMLAHQYGLLNAYALLVDAYHAIEALHYPLSAQMQLAIGQSCKEFSQLFLQMNVRPDYSIASSLHRCQLPNLAAHIDKTAHLQPELIMALLNLKLGLDLLNRHTMKLAVL